MGKSKAGDLYIASVIHVMRPGKDAEGKSIKVTETIKPGQMVSDTDLTDDEVKDLMRHKGVLRAPTFEEIQALESKPDADASAKAAADVEADRVKLLQEQQVEKDRLDAEQKAAEAKAKAKLEEQQAKDRAEAEKKAAGSGKKK